MPTWVCLDCGSPPFLVHKGPEQRRQQPRRIGRRPLHAESPPPMMLMLMMILGGLN